MKTYDPHPIAEIHKVMSESKVSKLAEDIKERGLIVPLWLYEGKLLDGRNRQAACLLAGVKPRYETYEGDTPAAFAASLNKYRRHETKEEVAEAVLKALPWYEKEAQNRRNPESHKSLSANLASNEANAKTPVKTQKEKTGKTGKAAENLAADFGVSRSTVERIKSAAKKTGKKEATAEEVQRDETGYPIPKGILPLWNRRDEITAILALIKTAERAVGAAYKSQDILFTPTNVQGIEARLSSCFTEFMNSMPYAVCTVCQGLHLKTCMLCKGKGFVSKFHYKTCVPRSIQDIREKCCENDL